MQPSLSRIRIKITVQGRGEAQAEALRHLAPSTIGALLRALPITGRATRFEDRFLYVTTNLAVGAEKSRSTFKRGDVAFLPPNGAVCIFLKDSTVARSMNPVGQIVSNLEAIEKIGQGEIISLERI